jgi:hypothetical protein
VRYDRFGSGGAFFPLPLLLLPALIVPIHDSSWSARLSTSPSLPFRSSSSSNPSVIFPNSIPSLFSSSASRSRYTFTFFTSPFLPRTALFILRAPATARLPERAGRLAVEHSLLSLSFVFSFVNEAIVFLSPAFRQNIARASLPSGASCRSKGRRGNDESERKGRTERLPARLPRCRLLPTSLARLRRDLSLPLPTLPRSPCFLSQQQPPCPLQAPSSLVSAPSFCGSRSARWCSHLLAVA